MLENIHGNIFFFSSSGISFDGIISDKVEENADIKLNMLKRANQSVYLCDHTKFNSNFLVPVCNISEIDCLINDQKPPEEICAKVENWI